MENYKNFSVGQLPFLDSMEFMSQSLDKLLHRWSHLTNLNTQESHILLLIDVFKTNPTYGSFPLHYYRTPVITWNPVPMITNVKLELIAYIPGVISMVYNRYAKVIHMLKTITLHLIGYI